MTAAQDPSPTPPACLLHRAQAARADWLSGTHDLHPFAALLQEARDLGEEHLEMEILSLYSRCLGEQAGDVAVQALYEDAHRYARAHLTPTRGGYRLARTLNALSTVERRQGRLDEAMAHVLEAHEYARQHGDLDLRFLIMNNLGGFLQYTGDDRHALARHEEAYDLACQLGRVRYRCISLTNRMISAARLGEHEAVQALHDELEACLSDPALTQDPREFRSRAALALHLSLHAQQRPREALACTDRGLACIAGDEAGAGRIASELHLARAANLRQLDRPAEALTAAETALKLAEARQEPLDQLAAHEELSRLHEQLGAPVLALAHLRSHHTLQQARQEQQRRAHQHALDADLRLHRLEMEIQLAHGRNDELQRANRELQRLQDELRTRITHDSLTGLLEREAFRAQVNAHLQTMPAHAQAAMLFIDLDSFRAINDLYGHQVGDLLLRAFAERLVAATPPNALSSRLGGDEFMVFLPSPMTEETVEHLAAGLLGALREPYRAAGRLIEMGASLGYALAPRDAHTAATLQRQADLAMHHAKRSGRHVLNFTPEMQRERDERLYLERELQGALARDEFTLHYQGRFGLPACGLAGFEALLRWDHPVQGRISPDKFIPLAERSGLILPLGAWVLRRACEQAVAWNFPARALSMSVNVSALQFEQPTFVQDVRAALQETGLPGAQLVLELTESMLLRDLGLARQHIQALRELDVQVALDDFGQGYSSLSVLQDLHFDHLKIDRAFIRSASTADPEQRGGSRNARTVLEVMLHLAHRLNIHVTAEGVETAEQLQLLHELGCDDVQGFLLGRPVPATAAGDLLGPLP